MTDIDPNALLTQLERYTANGALNSQYSLPVLGRLADAATAPLDGEQLIEALLEHGDPAIAAMVPRVKAARQTETVALPQTQTRRRSRTFFMSSQTSRFRSGLRRRKAG